MKRGILLIALILLSSNSALTHHSKAQSSLAQVDIECRSQDNNSVVSIEVHPGASLENVAICIVSNPSVYQEKISIDIQSGVIQSSGPDSITLQPNTEEEFQILLRASAQMPEGTHMLVVNATVQEMNGVPPPNDASSEYHMLVAIPQFAGLDIEVIDPVIVIEGDGAYQLEYYIYNQGNARDRFAITLSETESLQSSGVSVALPAVAMEVESLNAQKFRVMLEVPENITEWTVYSDDSDTSTFWFHVRVTSSFSCRMEGICLWMEGRQQVTIIQNQTIEPVQKNEPVKSQSSAESMSDEMMLYLGAGGGLMLLVLCLALLRRRNTSSSTKRTSV